MWRNVRGHYQSKPAEVTSDLNAAMFFGGIDLYSVHWVTSRKQITTGRALGGYSDFTVSFTIIDFGEANCKVWVATESSPARTKIRDVYPMVAVQIYPTKKHGGVQTWHHFRSFELILTTNIPSHFSHETIYRKLYSLFRWYAKCTWILLSIKIQNSTKNKVIPWRIATCFHWTDQLTYKYW